MTEPRLTAATFYRFLFSISPKWQKDVVFGLKRTAMFAAALVVVLAWMFFKNRQSATSGAQSAEASKDVPTPETTTSLKPIDYKVPFDCNMLPAPFDHFCKLQQDVLQNQVSGDCNSLPIDYQGTCRAAAPLDPVLHYADCNQLAEPYRTACQQCTPLGPRFFWQCFWEKTKYPPYAQLFRPKRNDGGCNVPVDNRVRLNYFAPWHWSETGGPRPWTNTVDWAQEDRWKPAIDPLDPSQNMEPKVFKPNYMMSWY